MWFDDLLELNFNAGVNIGFQGVYDSTNNRDVLSPKPAGCGTGCVEYRDRMFEASLKLDVSGQINVTKEAAIQFSANNITNSTQQQVTIADTPWVLGRSYWLGLSLRF